MITTGMCLCMVYNMYVEKLSDFICRHKHFYRYLLSRFFASFLILSILQTEQREKVHKYLFLYTAYLLYPVVKKLLCKTDSAR